MQNHLTSGVQIFHFDPHPPILCFLHIILYLFHPSFLFISFSPFIIHSLFHMPLFIHNFFINNFFFLFLFIDDEWMIQNNHYLPHVFFFSLSTSPTLIFLHSILSSSYTNSTNPMIGLENFVFSFRLKGSLDRFYKKTSHNFQFKLKGVH